MQANTTEIPENAIAVIGMDCRFPKANSTEEYWDNLVKGVSGASPSFPMTSCAGQASAKRRFTTRIMSGLPDS